MISLPLQMTLTYRYRPYLINVVYLIKELESPDKVPKNSLHPLLTLLTLFQDQDCIITMWYPGNEQVPPIIPPPPTLDFKNRHIETSPGIADIGM